MDTLDTFEADLAGFRHDWIMRDQALSTTTPTIIVGMMGSASGYIAESGSESNTSHTDFFREHPRTPKHAQRHPGAPRTHMTPKRGDVCGDPSRVDAHIGRTVEGMRLHRRYDLTDRRKKAFERREGEDPYSWVARQIVMARPHEIAQLTLMRNDEKQLRALELAQQAKTALWARLAAACAALSALTSVYIALRG